MRAIIKSDMYKLVRDRQTIFLVLFYFLFDALTWTSPAIDINSLSAQEILDISTADFGILFLFITVTAVSVFALDYSNDTLKDILPFYSRKTVFSAKLIVVVFVGIIVQVLCLLPGVLYSMVFSSSFPDISILKNYMNRFIVHYLINLVNIGFILFLASFFKQRYIINALVLVSLLITRFFPIGNGQFLYQYLAEQYAWGEELNLLFLIGTPLIIIVLLSANLLCFIKRQV